MLTRGLWWPGLRRKEEDDDDRRRRGSGARGPTATGGLRGSNYSGSTQEAPAQVIKKLREPGTQRRGRIAAAEQITGGGVVAQFRRCRGLGLQCRLEKLLGIEAGRLRGSWWSEARQSARSTVRPRRLARRSEGTAALGFWVAAG
jgi:hypothetical protein